VGRGEKLNQKQCCMISLSTKDEGRKTVGKKGPSRQEGGRLRQRESCFVREAVAGERFGLGKSLE